MKLILTIIVLLLLAGCTIPQETQNEGYDSSDLLEFAYESCKTGCVFGTSNVRGEIYEEYTWTNERDGEFRESCVDLCTKYITFLNEYEEEG